MVTCQAATTRSSRFFSSQQLRELGSVVDGFVSVTVVHQEVDLLRTLSHRANLGEPFLELLLLVRVIEAFRGGKARLFPVLRVAAVKAHDRELVVRHP